MYVESAYLPNLSSSYPLSPYIADIHSLTYLPLLHQLADGRIAPSPPARGSVDHRGIFTSPPQIVGSRLGSLSRTMSRTPPTQFLSSFEVYSFIHFHVCLYPRFSVTFDLVYHFIRFFFESSPLIFFSLSLPLLSLSISFFLQESLMAGRLPATSANPVQGFNAEICASGLGKSCPRLRLPLLATYYNLPGQSVVRDGFPHFSTHLYLSLIPFAPLHNLIRPSLGLSLSFSISLSVSFFFSCCAYRRGGTLTIRWYH